MQAAFDHLSGAIEWFLSQWWGASLYLGIAAACAIPWGWDGPDRFLTYTGGVILVLLIGGARRDSKAVHAKLDDVTPGAELNRIEERSEAEIEARRATSTPTDRRATERQD